MATRRVLILLSLAIAWASFGFVLKIALDLQSEHCQRFADLAAECVAPFALVLAGASLLLFLATAALGALAWRTRTSSDGV